MSPEETAGRCGNCHRLRRLHVGDRCPSLGLHVSLDADSVQRAVATGHPKLLRAVIGGAVTNKAMTGVSIVNLRVGRVVDGVFVPIEVAKC